MFGKSDFTDRPNKSSIIQMCISSVVPKIFQAIYSSFYITIESGLKNIILQVYINRRQCFVAIRAFKWRNNFAERWSSQGASLGDSPGINVSLLHSILRPIYRHLMSNCMDRQSHCLMRAIRCE